MTRVEMEWEAIHVPYSDPNVADVDQGPAQVCEMPLPHFEDFRPCGERSRYRLERADAEGDDSWSPYEVCPRHVPEALFDLGSGDEVQIIVTLHYGGEI